ncbi:hypothetical protein QUB80_04570 [Chlorogloeopsis sp. ULAP01]|nr:hypothetical protein [Chlorogloeopsis sp. ULAP01]MDM9379972.1 hypothetical protein [Chlorogloeopsis sp. ULAP01]
MLCTHYAIARLIFAVVVRSHLLSQSSNFLDLLPILSNPDSAINQN